MPFDDVCQIAPQGANIPARWPEIFFLLNSLPLGGGAPGGCYPNYIPTKFRCSEYDLENHPTDFSETLHTGLESNPKNYFLLAFFRIFSKSWSKMQQKLPMDIKNATFRLWGPITFSRVPGAVRTWTTILLSIVGAVRGQVLVRIRWKLTEKLTQNSVHLLRILVYLCHFRPKFFPEPLQEATPAQFSAEQTHLALNTEFQHSRIPGRKVVGLRKFSKKRKKCKK